MQLGALTQEFRANGSTKLLVRGKDATLGHFVDHQINELKWEAWKVLPEAVRTGQVAFALAHDGMDMHQVYFHCVSPSSYATTQLRPACMHPCLRVVATM